MDASTASCPPDRRSAETRLPGRPWLELRRRGAKHPRYLAAWL